MDSAVAKQIRSRNGCLRYGRELLTGGVSDNLLGKRIDGDGDNSDQRSEGHQYISVGSQYFSSDFGESHLPAAESPYEFERAKGTPRCLVKSLQISQRSSLTKPSPFQLSKSCGVLEKARIIE